MVYEAPSRISWMLHRYFLFPRGGGGNFGRVGFETSSLLIPLREETEIEKGKKARWLDVHRVIPDQYFLGETKRRQ